MALLKVEPHGNALAGHVFLHLADAELAEMEHACGKHRIGLAIDDAFCEMLELANAAARNNGNAYRPGNCASERYIKAGIVPSRSMLVSRISPAPR